MRRLGRSLIVRLAVAIALVIVIASAAVAVAAFAYGRSAAQQSYDRLLIGAARQIAQAITLKDGALAVDLPVSAFELLSLAPQDRIVYAVRDAGGTLVTGYGDLRAPSRDAEFFRATFGGEAVRVVRVERQFAERDYVGAANVLVGHTMRARRELAGQITKNALITTAIIMIVMALLAALAVRSALAPLRRIERHMAGRSARDLTAIDPGVPSEVEGLVLTLNRFMDRLQRQIVVMKNLIADASHQLRTPIAALRAQADLAAGETDPAALQRIAGRIYRRSETLSHLTEQLLTQALVIHRADIVDMDAIDLRVVAVRVFEETDHEVFNRDQAPRLDLPEHPVGCLGDTLSLVEACKNLLGNALRYGAPPVSLVVGTGAEGPFIAVRDRGAGIPREEWPDAGERYVRSSGISPDRSGLGLAIVSAVARAHGGALCFAQLEPCGFEAALVLPAAEAAQS